MDQRPPQSGYASVNGLSLYYELHGVGEPLVLLHGGVVGIPMLDPLIAALAPDRQIVAVELQGHGRTGDIDRPLAFEAMADDIAALVTQLGLAPVDLMGYSLGSGVALQTVILHPEVVRRLVAVSQPFRHDGWYPEVRAAYAQMGPAAAAPLKGSPFAQLFPNVDWDRLFTKLGTLLRQDFDWSQGVAGIAVPTLLVFADADAIRPAHMVEFFALLGGGQRDAGLDGSGRPTNQLAILPGLTHYDIIASPRLAATVAPFLDAPSS